ncbi:hypothetical protein SODALDRAFT_381233 [Sodiomyces alkalinus F11]|uniref:Uncharacterized protein n=1 Tax=Sodiomyces alkalinus (strain CBS 110278 / VKM F-3762 / F11) TaxID=1314773 RepID=A0A3N2PN54_SODAK|nr:hypothetical protein SODALDRAFT_381233 [Sodiomyces alkalinus F11]ROT35955.1 hypothetical protein SODALDRAFT_381233 [Sodiomyces alkalinus F11]
MSACGIDQTLLLRAARFFDQGIASQPCSRYVFTFRTLGRGIIGARQDTPPAIELAAPMATAPRSCEQNPARCPSQEGTPPP